MAKVKYSEFSAALDAAATLDGTETVVVIQDGVPVESTTQDIADLGGGGAAAYLVYTALLSQSGTDDPVATVLQNTLGGTVVWTRQGQGEYHATLAGAFTQDKCICFCKPGNYNGNQVFSTGFSAGVVDTGTAILYAYDATGTGLDFDTSGSYEVSVEIRVYP